MKVHRGNKLKVVARLEIKKTNGREYVIAGNGTLQSKG